MTRSWLALGAVVVVTAALGAMALAQPTGQGAIWDWFAPGVADGAPHWQVFWQRVTVK